MIPRALRIAFLFLLRLFIPAPPQRTRIDPAAPCPACGHTKGEIRAVQQGNVVLVRHDCETCRCRWYEEPIRSAAEIKMEAAPTA